MSTADYLIDHDYPPVYHPEQSPGWLAAVLSAIGRQPAQRGSWCELGCGQGFNVSLMAAANPDMRFTGIDLNPQHIATAEARAKTAGLTNVQFHCADIRTVDGLAGPFDVIVSHGVLSWVPASVREAIAAFVGRQLAPGGVAALQYMSEPGGAAFRAFHAVFRACAGSPEPVKQGLQLLCAMRDAKAGFFQLHPHASQTLDNLLKERPGYIEHEYMNPTFEPLAFGEVHALLAGVGLQWQGSATPLENIDAVSLPAQAGEVATRVPDLVLRETLKDLARNQPQRYDLFMQPAAAPSAQQHMALLRAGRWRLLPGAPAPGGMQLDTPIGPVQAQAAVFAPFLTRLAEGPASFAELEALAPFNGRPGLLNQTLQMSLWAGIVHPERELTVGGFDSAPAARLNACLLREAAAGAHVPALAAPLLGSGLALNAERLRALLDGNSDPTLRTLLYL
ncbi:class I SAM-dependent methyltransferase [Halopseudomonas pachastrellae]|uniref:class I SAM-dependent methyltransferase n=1 Tax=Halopseudomonas pachastrellae TaxID=254161 RepID=UPI003D7F16B1